MVNNIIIYIFFAEKKKEKKKEQYEPRPKTCTCQAKTAELTNKLPDNNILGSLLVSKFGPMKIFIGYIFSFFSFSFGLILCFNLCG